MSVILLPGGKGHCPRASWESSIAMPKSQPLERDRFAPVTSPLRSLWLVTLVVTLTIVGGMGIAQGLPGSPGPAPNHPGTSAVAASVHSNVTFPTSVRHVITVLLENQDTGNVLSKGAFERHLIAKYGYASNYYAICHPSAPNYLGLTSGESDQCGSDSYNVYSTTNIADLVQNAGLTWASYAESLPSPCYTGNSGNFVVRHVPLLFYKDIVSNSTRCDSHIEGFNGWNSSVSSGDLPNYVFITPNILDDGHNTGVSYADQWLKNWLSPLLNDSFFQSSVFLIVYDESGGTTTGYDGLYGGKVYFAAVGPDVYENSTYSADASHYNLLETTEWLLGLGNTGHNDNRSSFPPMKSLFRTPTSNSTNYTLSGDITAASTGDPISGVDVSVAGGPSTTTNSSGGYQMALANGSYSLTASAPGFVPSTGTVTIAGANVVQNFTLAVVAMGLYPVSGTVSDSSNGAPIAGATVAISGGGSLTTSSNGTYAIPLSNGTYNLTASDPGYQSTSSSVTVAGTSVTLNFTLTPGAPAVYSVSGLVEYASNRSPASGVTVALSSTGSQITGPSGNYLFSVVNGSYNLTVEKAGLSTQSAAISVLGSSVVENFTLEVPVFPLTGMVISQVTGSALPGANVSLSPTVWQITGQSGRFSFLVPNGTYELEIVASGYSFSVRNVSVGGGPVSQNISIGLATTPTGPGGTPSGSPVWPWVALAGVVVALAIASLALLLRRRRSRQKTRAARLRRPVR